MDQLEKLIIQHRNELENDQPHEGHFERFEIKLDKQQKRKPLRILSYASSIAAILVLAIIVFMPEKSKSNSFTLSNVSSQYAEVEFYYTSSINKQINKVKDQAIKLGANNSSFQLQLDELEEYDEQYDQLCSDLGTTPNDERVINALLIYYQTKLEIITKILSELENQRLKIDSNENSNI
jgi:hypothetical protein